MHDLTACVLNHEEHIQRLEAERTHAQEIAGPDALGVFLQKCLPPRGGLAAPRSSHILPHRPGREYVAELQELGVDSDLSPERILLHHPTDERSRFQRNPLSPDASPS